MTRYRFDTTPEISRRMAKVKTHNGKAETLLAKRLWHLGYRYKMYEVRCMMKAPQKSTKDDKIGFI